MTNMIKVETNGSEANLNGTALVKSTYEAAAGMLGSIRTQLDNVGTLLDSVFFDIDITDQLYDAQELLKALQGSLEYTAGTVKETK